MTYKVLNLYAGIGGNRKLLEDVDVTAVEINPEIARIYQDFFPDDAVIITDAHQYLLEHYDDGWDFIWSSILCISHTRIRNVAGVGRKQYDPIYPDMKLYEEIIFLNKIYYTSGTQFDGKWVVENVVSYYEPLIKPQQVGRHYFWSNFTISDMNIEPRKTLAKISDMQKRKGFDLSKYKLEHRKDTILRNCVEPELGLHIFNCAFKLQQQPIEIFS